MTWTETEPGAGDVAAARGLAHRVDDAGERLHDLARRLGDAADPISPDTWAGRSADAWLLAHEECEEHLRRFARDLIPASDALATYAGRVEEIAEEAELARRQHGLALDDLAQAARRSVPHSDPARERTRLREAEEDRRAVQRRTDRLLGDLVDRRRAADREVLAALDPVPAVAWPQPRAAAPLPLLMPTGPGLGDLASTASTVSGAWSAPSQAEDLRRFIDATTQEPWNERIRVRNVQRADAAVRSFIGAEADGGLLGRIARTRFSGTIGKVATPSVFRVLARGSFIAGGAMGAVDFVTGGGYDGARGWATSGFGLAGAAGTVVLIGSKFAIGAAFGPVGLGIAMGAVLAYTAWSVGNLIWDHREAIGEWFSTAGRGIRDAASRARQGVSTAASKAASWIGGRAAQVVTRGGRLADLGRSLLRVPRLGLP